MFEKAAYAAGGQGPAEASPIPFFFMMLSIFAIFYFLVAKPQQKQRREQQKMIEALKKGDKIVTAGGILGTITSIQNDYVVIRTGDNDQTKMEVLKSAISGLRT